MAQNSLGLNMTFPIKQEDGTSFHDLILYKATSDSVVMSLGDKITGDVYYKDNTLDVTMSEYIEYKANPDDENEEPIHYILVNPPTIVREGMVSDNSELKGMTKYSFEFYHPMYQLGNFPFTDVATTSDEEKYLSENKSFSWIGKPQDFIDKLNKNLQGTAWYVRKSNRFPVEKDDELSEVQQFDKISVAEAIKKGYEIWEIPYIVSQLPSNDPLYAQGKRFVVEYGLPSNEIYENESARQLDTPFVFHMGQGVGLKNNSRTPRNNKIVTRIAGFGSEDNIPYGYPQIIWTGNQDWEYTINNDANNPLSYPIYSGIVGGRYVKLIKHPFTRSHLMPSIFSETVNKKVNPNAEGYNPNIEIKDYYDAVATQEYPYPNEINPQVPSYENHEFEDIKPELDSERNTGIISATPLNNDLTPADHWDDEIDDNGSYIQSYFKIKLPQLSFDLYACAAITQEMQVNMRSGSCIGCTFTVSVDWDDYKNNFYDVDGNFAPDGSQRNLDKYPKSNLGEIEIILQKDNNTFGKIMPNVYQQPNSGDLFVFIGISLPTSYIKEAEEKLDDAMKSYMLENNVYYFDYPLKFDEYFLATHKKILGQIHPNSIIHFDYGGEELQLYVKQLTVKYGNNPLPQYDITLTDNIEITLNQIGQVASDVEKLSSLISILRQTYSRNVWAELSKKLSKVQDDTAQGFITFLKGLQVGNQFVSGLLGEGGVFRKDEDGKVYIEADKLYIRTKAYFDNVEIKDYEHTSGNRIASKAGMKCVKVEAYNSSDVLLAVNPETEPNGTSYYRCYFRAKDGEETINNDFVVGDQAFCDKTTFDNNNLSHHRYWRLVVGKNGTLTEEEDFGYIDLSASDKESGSNVPLSGDDISQLGNRNVQDRQGAIIEYVGGDNAPSYQIYQNINSYSLEGKNVIDMGFNSQTGRARMNVAGDFRFGSQTDNGSYVKYDQSTGTLNIKANVEFTNSDSDLDEFVQSHQRDDSYDDTDVQNALTAINGSIGSINSGISDINNSITSINATTQNLQDQIDGAITTYFMSGVPTLANAPASSWTTDVERNKHINDLYYDKDTGYGYHFLYDDSEKKYKWVVITDKDVTKALADAAKAQATADSKRTVYSVWGAWVQSGVNTLEIGDLFIPASDTTQGNVTYKANKVYKCTTTGSNAFQEVAYTDDTKVNGILGNTYYQQLAGGTINSLIGTAQTTADTAVTNAANAQTSANNANNKLTSWANSGKIAPTEILALKNQKTDIENEYAQIIADANRYSVNNASFVTAYNNAIAALNYHTDETHAASDGTITIVTDTTQSYYFGYISSYYSARQTILNSIAAKAKEYAETQGNKFLNDAVYKAIKAALGSKTDIAGGLVLTSLIGMRQNTGTSENPQYVVWGGISGEYDANAKGKGIAAWYGGEMSDKEDTATTSERPAQSLFRFDGSGYLAGGNISWDKDGVVTIANVYSVIGDTQVAWGAETLQYMTNLSNLLPIKVINSVTYLDPKVSLTALGIKENLSVGGNLSVSGILSVGSNIKINNKDVATQEWVNNNYITKSFFDSLFQLYNDTTKIDANGTIPSSSKLNIKAMFGFWTEQYISALGKNASSSGGGGNVGVLNDLNDVTLTSPTANQILVFDGTHWKNQNQQSVYQLPQATSSALGGIKIGYTTTGKNYAIQLDSNGKAFVNVPWENTTYSFVDSNPTLAWGTKSKVATIGGVDIHVTMPANPNTDHHAWSDITGKPTTLGGYGITDAKIANGIITLGSNSIAPLTSHQTLYTLSVYGGTTKVLDYKPNANASLYIKAGGDISLTNDTTNRYITLSYSHPTNGANTTISAANGKVLSAITVNSLGHVTSVSSKTLVSDDIPSLAISKITNLQSSLDNKLSLSGGTMSGTAVITFADSGNWGKSNEGVTFPVVRGGFYWSGQSDWISLKSIETANDNLDLVLQFGDDNSNGLSVRNKDNTQVARINATGIISAASFVKNGGLSSQFLKADGSIDSTAYLPLAGGTMTGGITCSTSGANLKWGNITIYGGGSNGGTNSILIGDDVTIGDCNMGGCFGMKSTGANAGFRFFNSSGTSIGGLQSSNGVLQWINSSGTAYNILDSGNSSKVMNIVSGAYQYTASSSLTHTSAQKDGFIYLDTMQFDCVAGETYIISCKTDGTWSNHDTSGKDPSLKLCSLWVYRISENTIVYNQCCGTKMPYVWTCPTTGTYKFRTNSYSDGTTALTVHFWDFKVERGQFATDWNICVTDPWVSALKLATARNISIADADSTNVGSATSFDGSSAVTLKLPATIKATLNGNASTATTASKLSTVSKTAWGQTFWTSGGVPTSISGALSSVTNITMSGYIKIGDAYLTYDSTNNAIRVSKNADGTGAANFYALGGVSALGAGSSCSGGSGVDMTTVWAALNNPTTEQINASHLSTALSGYATQSWVQGQGYLTSHQSLANYATKTWVSQTYLPLTGGTITGNLIIGGSDIPEVADNLLNYASVHSIKFYRNGFLIPYQMDNTNDGGFFRVRGTTEDNVVCEIGTWDDSGSGETIQFNYYPTTSTINPTYSVSVPKATGTLALTSQIPTKVSQLTNDSGYLTPSNSSVSKSGETLTVKINNVTQSLTNTIYSAGAGLRLNGTTIISNAPRVAKDSKVFGGQNTWIMEEYASGANYNLPSNAWYHIMSTQGVDTGYGTQLALGMTTEGAYYRKYDNRTWTAWKSLINTDTTYSAGTGISLSGTTFSNSGVRSTTINGNYLRVNTNGTNTDLTIPYASYAKELYNAVYVDSGNTVTYPWRRIATTGLITNNYNDTEATILIRHWRDEGVSAILKISLRTNTLSSGDASSAHAVWLVRSQNYPASNVKIALYSVQGKAYADVYLKATTLERMYINVIANNGWTFKSSQEGDNGTNPVEAYTSIEAAATALYGVAYTSITDSYDVGIVSRAISDSDGNAINTTYLKRSGGTMSNTNVVTNLNADLLDGYHLTSDNTKPWGHIPFIGTDGVMEVGKYFDFHFDNTTGSDFSTRLWCTGNHHSDVRLPSATGTLALTSDNVASATKLQTARTLWGQSFDGTGNVNGKITLTYNADEQLRISASYTSGTNSYSHCIKAINPSLSSGEAYLYEIGRSASSTNTAYFGYVYGGDSGTSYATIGLYSHDRILNVTASDMVGIGTTTPSYKLDVNGTLHASGATTLSSTLSVTGNTTLASALSVSRSHVQITNAALVVDGDTTFYDSVTLKETLFLGSDDDVTLSVDGATNGESGGTFDIEAATGYVIQLWNNTNILADLSTSGDITANGNITSEHNILAKGGVTALSTSDRRKKTNITKANSIDTLKSLGGTFEFDWIDGSGHSIGFIAQNVEKSALNDMVYTTDDGYMKLNYLDTRLISLAVGGIIEVDDEVTKLKKRVKELEEEVKQLKAN